MSTVAQAIQALTDNVPHHRLARLVLTGRSGRIEPGGIKFDDAGLAEVMAHLSHHDVQVLSATSAGQNVVMELEVPHPGLARLRGLHERVDQAVQMRNWLIGSLVCSDPGLIDEVCRITSLAFRDVDAIAERHRRHAR